MYDISIKFYAHLFSYHNRVYQFTFNIEGCFSLLIYCLGSNINPCGVIAATAFP